MRVQAITAFEKTTDRRGIWIVESRTSICLSRQRNLLGSRGSSLRNRIYECYGADFPQVKRLALDDSNDGLPLRGYGGDAMRAQLACHYN